MKKRSLSCVTEELRCLENQEKDKLSCIIVQIEKLKETAQRKNARHVRNTDKRIQIKN